MNKTLLAAVFVVAAVGTAKAGDRDGAIGVGAEHGLAFTPGVVTTAGLGFASMNYDAGAFHVGGFLGFADGGGNNDTDYGIGARFYYHVHSGSMADFGIGGNLGILSIDDRMGGDRRSFMFLEPGIQIRMFLASNVALSFTTGITIGLIDADGFAVGGQPTGAAGVHYYFF